MATNLTKRPESNLTSADLNALFGVDAIGDDLSAGVTGGFAVVSFRGSKWRVKYQGDENLVRDSDGDAVAKLECVLLKASKDISKIYYAKAYEEGDNAAPDCFSANGVLPDPSSTAPQAKSCAVCPHNVWGSRITPAGKKAKACSDHRRVAIVPANDLENKMFGGPMLLRVSPASLGELAQYGAQLRGKGIGYNTVVTKLSFDEDASYPKLSFTPVRRLSKDEVLQLVPHMQSDTLTRILSEVTEYGEGAEAEDDVIPTPPPKPVPQKAAAAPSKSAPQKAAAAPSKPAPASRTKPAQKEEDLVVDPLFSGSELMGAITDDLSGALDDEPARPPAPGPLKAKAVLAAEKAQAAPRVTAPVDTTSPRGEDLDDILQGLDMGD